MYRFQDQASDLFLLLGFGPSILFYFYQGARESVSPRPRWWQIVVRSRQLSGKIAFGGLALFIVG